MKILLKLSENILSYIKHPENIGKKEKISQKHALFINSTYYSLFNLV